MKADEIIERIKSIKDETYEEILALYHEMCAYLKSDAPKIEKAKLTGLGYGEMLGMMIDDEDRI